MQLSASQIAARELAREFARREIAPHAARWDREASFPAATIRKMGEVGLLGMSAPEAWGGSGADSLAVALAIEEIAFADASCALVLSMANSLTILSLLTFANDRQKARWLPGAARGEYIACFAVSEPHAGSNAAQMRTHARKAGDRYLISGTKQFITTGSVARLAFVFASTDPSAGAKGIGCFLVPTDRPGYIVARKEDKLGVRASDTCQIVLDNLEVSEEEMLGRPGEGYRIALHGLTASRIGVAAQAVGVARAAFELAAAYARERLSFERPLIEHQGVGFMLADMAAEIEAAHLLTLQACQLKDQGQPYAAASSIAKLYAGAMAERVCSKAIQIHGGYGYMRDLPLEKMYRDARAFQIYEGTSEIQRLIIARTIAERREVFWP
jgi:alkylation response protein AidB-like acyl-CoA dehydrogenase